MVQHYICRTSNCLVNGSYQIMIVYIRYLVQQEQLQKNDPVAVSCPENEWFILMTLETVIKVSISRFTNQTSLLLLGGFCCYF